MLRAALFPEQCCEREQIASGKTFRGSYTCVCALGVPALGVQDEERRDVPCTERSCQELQGLLGVILPQIRGIRETREPSDIAFVSQRMAGIGRHLKAHLIPDTWQ